jgi:hypothetical protein
MEKKTRVQELPFTQYKPNVNFSKTEIDDLVTNKGYDVHLEKALMCPCRGKENGAAQGTCKNCGGTGWVFINRTKTKAILHSMNLNTKYTQWSAEKIGTVNITTMSRDTLGYMDRLTVIGAESEMNQLLFPYVDGGNVFAFTNYEVKSVVDMFYFAGSSTRLELLTEGVDFTVEGSIIKFSERFINDEQPTFTVRYKHAPAFHVLDLTREVLMARVRTEQNPDFVDNLPVSAVGKRAHYILDMQNYNGDRLYDNSYERCTTY